MSSVPTTSSALRVGVVGVGSRSRIVKHLHLPQCHGTVVAACDPLPVSVERLRDWCQIDPATVTITPRLEEFIDVGLDAAVITSPDDTHADVAVALLAAGIPVYLEKPIAISVDGATRILQTAFDAGTRLYVGHNMRHMSVVRLMRDLITRGDIGEVKAIWCRHFVGNGGDYYFKDWHSDRSRSNGLLLQKAAHDLDVMNWFAGSHATRVVGMGGLMVYGQIHDHQDRTGNLMFSWLDHANWPPLSQRGLNPVVDVEDLSMVMAEMESGVMTSYQQCHFTPDYWRNYTIIGTEGRLENFGDGGGGHVKVWSHRCEYDPDGDAQYPIAGNVRGHEDADALAMAEFTEFVRSGAPTQTSPLSSWYATVEAIQATRSLREGSTPHTIPQLPPHLIDYFNDNQVKPAATGY